MNLIGNFLNRLSVFRTNVLETLFVQLTRKIPRHKISCVLIIIMVIYNDFNCVNKGGI